MKMPKEWKPGERLPPSAMRLLTAIAWCMERQLPLTVRRLRKVIGATSYNALSFPLQILESRGFIKSEKDNYGGLRRGAAAIRITCRFIPADQLGKE